jgi:hypothetical protein
VSGTSGDLATPSRDLLGPASGSTFEADRRAILEDCYEARRSLVEAKLLGKATSSQLRELVEIDREIDRWEGMARESARDGVWDELEALARDVAALNARVVGPRSRG